MRWLTDLGVVGDVQDSLSVLDPDANDELLFVPALAGLGAPWWRTDAKASFVGLTLSTSRADIVLSVLRGIATQIVDVLMVVGKDAEHPVDVLRVDGGLANSAPFMQLQSDLAQIPVEVYPSPNATALGVAAAAEIGLWPERSVDAIVGSWIPQARYEPRWSADRAANYAGRWREAVATSLATVGGTP